MQFEHSGKVGTVNIKTDTTPNLEDQGVHCMFVGYSLMHATGCYRMYNTKTHRVCISCDVVWLHRMHYKKNNKELVMIQSTVGNWHKNPQGMSRFIDVGEGIFEVPDQANDNNTENTTVESSMEEQATEIDMEEQAPKNDQEIQHETMVTP